MQEIPWLLKVKTEDEKADKEKWNHIKKNCELFIETNKDNPVAGILVWTAKRIIEDIEEYGYY